MAEDSTPLYNTKTESAWEKIFDRYDIVKEIARKGTFQISADQIKDFREPRLMVKFDHSKNLPPIFKNNKLGILPITRGDYVIGHFENYHVFEEETDNAIETKNLPPYIQSLSHKNIMSEALSLSCGYLSGIFPEFLDEERLASTINGRMKSGEFDFRINNVLDDVPYTIKVKNSQVEIDGGYEGVDSLVIVEAKMDLAEDFLIRQLYYPYRLWSSNADLNKKVRPLFSIFSNGIYHLYEYEFLDPHNYNSLQLVKQKKYSLEDTKIHLEDIEEVFRTVRIVPEPEAPFPQADKFERVVNLCELLDDEKMNKQQITDNYDFDPRQSDYYANAARYLGYVKKETVSKEAQYSLTDLGERVLACEYKERQLRFCRQILSHKVFHKAFEIYLKSGDVPDKKETIKIMKASNLYKVETEVTYGRRASTIRGWINWIIGLIQV